MRNVNPATAFCDDQYSYFVRRKQGRRQRSLQFVGNRKARHKLFLDWHERVFLLVGSQQHKHIGIDTVPIHVMVQGFPQVHDRHHLQEEIDNQLRNFVRGVCGARQTVSVAPRISLTFLAAVHDRLAATANMFLRKTALIFDNQTIPALSNSLHMSVCIQGFNQELRIAQTIEYVHRVVNAEKLWP